MSQTDSRRLRLFITFLVLTGTGTPGCALFPAMPDTPRNTLALRPIVEPRDGIWLDAWYIDRPVDDPLTGDALWREIDQINTIGPNVRFKLNEAGIRFGVAGSDLPTTLSALLSDTESSAIQRTRRHQIPLFSGEPGELEVANLPQPCRIRMPGQLEVRDYPSVRCVFQVTAQRIQEGWVRLDFVPEIHYGNPRVRPLAATGSDWQMQQSQQVELLYEQWFSLDLNVGEHVVIGAVDGNSADSVGQHFFRGGEAEPRQERLIVLQVQGMERVDPVPVRDWTSLKP